MATLAEAPRVPPRRATLLDRIVSDRVLAAAAALMLAVVVAALVRGRGEWGRIPWPVWAHLATMATALGLTPVMLLRAKGTRSHRVLGWTWAAAMLATAAISLGFKTGAGRHSLGVFTGDVSPIHLLSLLVLVMVPRLVAAARRHDVAAHRRGVRGIVVGALLVAGFFTFPFDRLLGHWLFS